MIFMYNLYAIYEIKHLGMTDGIVTPNYITARNKTFVSYTHKLHTHIQGNVIFYSALKPSYRNDLDISNWNHINEQTEYHVLGTW